MMSQQSLSLASMVAKVVDSARVTDMHTHLFAPEMGSLLLSGADELLSFHYLISESFRVHRTPYDQFWGMEKSQRAELVWSSLFEKNSPLSEAASGVLVVAKAFGCDMKRLTIAQLREALSDVPTAAYISRVMELSGVNDVVMTNDPFVPAERQAWEQLSGGSDPRFHASLRLDQLLNQYDTAHHTLQEMGYQVEANLSDASLGEIQRFLEAWIDKTNPVYVAFSVADDFVYPEQSTRGRILDRVILPVCRERKLPISLMIGARRGVNPALREAGDSVAKASARPVERICEANPDNKFLVTMLSRENQHELIVAARKFHNLMIFGCWWFVNTDTLVEEITRMRMELLGPTFIPQHSDARILEQLIYKWQRARTVVKRVLTDKYEELVRNGWEVQEADVQRDVDRLFNRNFWDFVGH